MVRIEVERTADVLYASHLLIGISQLVGDSSIGFVDPKGWPEHGDSRGCRMKVLRNSAAAWVLFSPDDYGRIDRISANRFDLYLKTNIRIDQRIPSNVMAAGPTFGIRPDNLRELIRFSMAPMAGGASFSGVAHSLRQLRSLVRRAPLSAFSSGRLAPRPYVFSAAWPWVKHPEANSSRARFFSAMRSIKLSVVDDTGFVPRRRGNPQEFRGLYLPRRYSHREYLGRVRKSWFVFNSPAVHGCLGWKLGEFLALGKAILSTPFSRILPEPLEHGKHVWFVEDDYDAIREGIVRLLRDGKLRRRLEAGATDYYENYLRPEVLAQRVLERI